MAEHPVAGEDGEGRVRTAVDVSVPGRRVVCPAGFGAIEGSCGDGAAGDLLVSWAGTGWAPDLAAQGGSISTR